MTDEYPFPDIGKHPDIERSISRTYDEMLKRRDAKAAALREIRNAQRKPGYSRCPVCQDFVPRQEMIEAWWRQKNKYMCSICFERLNSRHEDKRS